ncbi:cell division protein ZapD [Pelistega sp. NLN82]|uniref:Cell division protein ZapD n=1 Tax=Pelistega ratti TaxID=2652177 RepID=A0A6L9Y886_9BURK|nr:cell division protein ZapD [Pelistega ratti]NEN76503.1 cell division protein ZapD [Pelistega ratti]
MILYEHPFNERIRYMIRLEYLFQQLLTFSKSPSAEGLHVAFAILFQIMDVCDRGDCRNWVLQEIEKQKASLESYRTFPDIDEQVLNATIQKLNQVSQQLASARKPGSHIRENEWLLSLKNRFLTPGSTSAMDIPSYTAWLNGNHQDCLHIFHQLIVPFMPLYNAVSQALSVIREAAIPHMESSKTNGFFEKNIGGRIYQMARIWLSANQRIYPEISANKHVVMIRFFRINDHFKQILMTEPIGFKMALCQI